MRHLELKILRELVLDMPAREVGKRVGYSYKSVLRFEQDHDSPSEYDRAFRKAFGLSEEELDAIRKAAELIEPIKCRHIRGERDAS